MKGTFKQIFQEISEKSLTITLSWEDKDFICESRISYLNTSVDLLWREESRLNFSNLFHKIIHGSGNFLKNTIFFTDCLNCIQLAKVPLKLRLLGLQYSYRSKHWP